MAHDWDSRIDQAMVMHLIEHGFMAIGPSRAYLEFESCLKAHEAELSCVKVQREFAELIEVVGGPNSVSKLDFHDADDERGHKLAIQFGYSDAIELLWLPSARPSFRELASAAVRLVRDDVRRSPVFAIFSDRGSTDSTIRGVTYYPGTQPGVRWHTDGCLLQFISIPAGDSALHISTGPAISDPNEQWDSATQLRGGPVPETMVLLGEQAQRLWPDARATRHAVSSIDHRRAVATHFVWLRHEGPLAEKWRSA